MIRFEKVSFKQFAEDCYTAFSGLDRNDPASEKVLRKVYDAVKLPVRSTKGSAGYDFFSPFPFCMDSETTPVIPTGIRFVTDRDDIALICLPRSGQGFKYQARLANTVGLVDSDYQYSSNEGHIKALMYAVTPFLVEKGQAFMQGVIIPYITTDDDCVERERDGGFGSTDQPAPSYQ